MSAVPSHREIIERRQRMGFVSSSAFVPLDLVRPAPSPSPAPPSPQEVKPPRFIPEPPGKAAALERKAIYERPSQKILREVCEKHGVSLDDVTGPRHLAVLVRCREEAVARLANETRLSYVQIGRILRKDHSTVIMAVRRWNEQTGENVRNAGLISPSKRERDRISARAAAEKLRLARQA